MCNIFCRRCEQSWACSLIGHAPLRWPGGRCARVSSDSGRAAQIHNPTHRVLVAQLRLLWRRPKACWGCRLSWRGWQRCSGERADEARLNPAWRSTSQSLDSTVAYRRHLWPTAARCRRRPARLPTAGCFRARRSQAFSSGGASAPGMMSRPRKCALHQSIW